MHECPDCGQVCDCDGEDTWYDWDSSEVEDCSHVIAFSAFRRSLLISRSIAHASSMRSLVSSSICRSKLFIPNTSRNRIRRPHQKAEISARLELRGSLPSMASWRNESRRRPSSPWPERTHRVGTPSRDPAGSCLAGAPTVGFSSRDNTSTMTLAALGVPCHKRFDSSGIGIAPGSSSPAASRKAATQHPKVCIARSHRGIFQSRSRPDCRGHSQAVEGGAEQLASSTRSSRKCRAFR